jgi:hypothetical protein
MTRQGRETGPLLLYPVQDICIYFRHGLNFTTKEIRKTFGTRWDGIPFIDIENGMNEVTLTVSVTYGSPAVSQYVGIVGWYAWESGNRLRRYIR